MNLFESEDRKTQKHSHQHQTPKAEAEKQQLSLQHIHKPHAIGCSAPFSDGLVVVVSSVVMMTMLDLKHSSRFVSFAGAASRSYVGSAEIKFKACPVSNEGISVEDYEQGGVEDLKWVELNRCSLNIATLEGEGRLVPAKMLTQSEERTTEEAPTSSSRRDSSFSHFTSKSTICRRSKENCIG
jgi:hypothetical protein